MNRLIHLLFVPGVPASRGRGGCWRFLVALAMALASTTALAQPVFEVPADVARVALTDHVEYLIDTTGRWRPESGEQPPNGWRPLSERHLNQGNFGFVSHPIWFRVTLRSAIAGERIWVVGTPLLDWVEWVLTAPGRGPEGAAAGLGPTQARQSNARLRVPTVTLPLRANEPLTVHMRVQTAGLTQVPMELWQPSAWDSHQRLVYMLLGNYFGLLAGLLAYNGFLALRLRDPAYGYYICFGLGLGVFQLCSTGVGPAFLWPDFALWTNRLLAMSGTVMALVGALFTSSFLHVQRFSPRLSWLLRATLLPWPLVLLSLFWLPVEHVTHWALMPLGVLTILLIMLSGVQGWLARAPASVYFMLGWSGLAIAILLRFSLRMGLLPPHALIYNGLLIASAVEMLVLSFALADRIAEERRARAEADTERAREQAAREQAQHALADKTRFMAAVTHDLQQPLYALSLATETVTRLGTGHVPAPALDQMRSAMHSADDLLATLVMNVRLERDELHPDIDDVSVQDLFERIDALFAARAQQADLRWRIWPGLGVVRTDSAMLERMLCNLVANALQYTRQGGVLLSCRTRADHLLIQVWDTGPGIAEHEQSMIFEPHRRGSSAHAHDKGPGLGLGLSIVSRCAQLLGIRVSLRSVPGRGSCFALWVPLSPTGT